ncbi:MAG: hypothetical protein ACOVRK_12085 [Chryseobacterium taeanense]
MRINIVLYIVYGLFIMIETFDFLEMLHTKPVDYSPTYSLVNVIFYQMEMFICFLCAFSLIILVSTKQTLKTILFINIILLIFRVGTVYYLYVYETEERWVPFIYKEANIFSTFFRRTFVPGQIIFGILTVIKVSKIFNRNTKDPKKYLK